MTLTDFVDSNGWPRHPIYAHLHRHGLISDNCRCLEDIAEYHERVDEIIAHLRGLSAWHLNAILAKSR